MKKGVLSIIIIVASDTIERDYDLSYLDGCLEALSRQDNPPAMEMIVAYPAQVSLVDGFTTRHPEVRFLPVSDLKTYDQHTRGRNHHDELRARGIAVASGEIVALLEDHDRPDPAWSREIVAAHRSPYAAIGGAIENGVDRPLSWAVYFCDFGKYQNPVPEGESPYASDVNIAYKRAALEMVKDTWKDNYNEIEVNWALIQAGEKIALSPRIIVFQHRDHLKLKNALLERFIWGQSYAVSRSRILSAPRRMAHAVTTPVLPVVLSLRMALNAFRKGRTIKAYVKAFPLIVLLTLFWSLGELSGYMAYRPASVSFQRHSEIPQP